MTSSKLFIKSNAQKQMTNSSFGHRLHDLKHFVLDLFFTSLKFIVNSRESLKKKFSLDLFDSKQIL